VDTKNKFYLEADIEIQIETDDLRKAVASVITLPEERDKQPDLLYFSAIFVSSGANLNHAYFQPSELVKAEGTIVNKALDIEHREDEIVGHIYDRVFTDKDGKLLNVEELSSKDNASVNEQEMHVVIAGIVYKNRFPELAKEISEGNWKVSMETYYRDYDVKIGNLVISRNEAESLGFADDESMVGKIAKVIKNKIEIAKGTIDRVLLDLVFSGCGFVEKPANPPSIVLETANEEAVKEEDKVNSKSIVVLDYAELDNNVTSEAVEDVNEEEEAELVYNDTIGICVSYKKEVIDSTFKDSRSEVLHTDWCALYEQSCTSFSRDTEDPKCLRTIARTTATTVANKLMAEKVDNDKRKKLLKALSSSLDKASLV
jgi:hypothetical protein